MQPKINVSILERYQATVDGYIYRLSSNPEIEVRSTFYFAEDLLNKFNKDEMDLLITGIDVHTSSDNLSPFPILGFLEQLYQKKSELKVLVISYFVQPQLIESLVDLGVNGFITKDDNRSIQNLATIVKLVSDGGTYFSQGIQRNCFSEKKNGLLTKRQMEVLFYCAAYPDESTYTLGKKLSISGSTTRNILSSIYIKLNVRTRTAAIMKARELGLLPSNPMGDDGMGNDNRLHGIVQ